MSNVYYNPEKWGLTVVADLHEDVAYQFDIIVIWQHSSGNYYWAGSSGCSCPTPFEEYRSLQDLCSLPDMLHELYKAVEVHRSDDGAKIKFLQIVDRFRGPSPQLIDVIRRWAPDEE